MNCVKTQGFSKNDNSSYKDRGIQGHSGTDYDCGHGTPVLSLYDFYCYKVIGRNQANDGSGFTGVFGIVDNGIELFEYLAGHLEPSAVVGQHYKKGDIIGTQSNHGKVYSGGVEITKSMQDAGDTRGSHTHHQKRPLKKKKDYNGSYFLTDTKGITVGGYYRDPEGYYYEIYDWPNGYNGCVDIELQPFNRNLYVGISGVDVYFLQRYLVRQGYATFEPTGFFGTQTYTALKAMQKKNNIMSTGFFGPLTRAFLNAKV